MEKGKKMGTVKGFLIIGILRGVKYYFLPTIESWTPYLNEVKIGDINEEKLNINMEDYPMMDKEYSHEGIIIEGNTGD